MQIEPLHHKQFYLRMWALLCFMGLCCRSASLAFALPPSSSEVPKDSTARLPDGNIAQISYYTQALPHRRKVLTGLTSDSFSNDSENPKENRALSKLQAINGGAIMHDPTKELDSNLNSDGVTEYVGKCELPTADGNFTLYSFRQVGAPAGPNPSPIEPVVLVASEHAGLLEGAEGLPVRIHDQCLTSEVLGSQRCDCKEQLDQAKAYIREHGGAVVYMQQEGRGIGLANKIAAYELQDGGMDTVDANRHLGFADDLRQYGSVPFILKRLGVRSVRLMTNNPRKTRALTDLGVQVEGHIPLRVPPNAHNARYLATKQARMAHRLGLGHGRAAAEDQLKEADAAAAAAAAAGAAVRGGAAGVVGGAAAAAAVDLSVEGGAGARKWCFGRESVLQAVEVIRQGGVVVVVDDEDRENEGDFIMAAEKATPEAIGFIVKHSSGVICVGMEGADLDRLALPPMVAENQDPKGTAFAVTVDAKGPGISTGISAGDRAATFRALAAPATRPADLSRPGHVFPLRARPGGVLRRDGHTEAAVDLCRLAGLRPAGVLCEITTADGLGMARLGDLEAFCARHGLVLTSIQDLISHREELIAAGESPF